MDSAYLLPIALFESSEAHLVHTRRYKEDAFGICVHLFTSRIRGARFSHQLLVTFLTEAEKQRILMTCFVNDTTGPHSQEICIHTVPRLPKLQLLKRNLQDEGMDSYRRTLLMSSYVGEQFCLSPRIDDVGKYSNPPCGFYLFPVSRFTVLSPGISNVEQSFRFVNESSSSTHEGPLRFTKDLYPYAKLNPSRVTYQIVVSTKSKSPDDVDPFSPNQPLHTMIK